MTENEAIKYIRSRICNERGIQRFCRDNCMYGKKQCAFQIAIQALDEIQQYRDAKEQGLLLRLPCKIGSTLYQPISNRINEYKAIGLCFDITRNEFMYEVAYQIGLEWHKTTCDFDCIGKTVFLTREEAEQMKAGGKDE